MNVISTPVLKSCLGHPVPGGDPAVHAASWWVSLLGGEEI